MIHDLTWWLYFLTAVACGIGGIVFTYSWWLSKQAIVRDAYITFLLWAYCGKYCVETYSRSLRFDSTVDYRAFMDGPLWSGRLIPPLIVLIFIVAHRVYVLTKK